MAKESVTELSDEQLAAEIAGAKQRLFDLRFALATGSLEDTTQIKGQKKRAARALTELREREIAAAEAAAEE